MPACVAAARRRGHSASSLRKESECEEPPGELDVPGEKHRGVTGSRKVAHAEHQCVDRARELRPALLGVEVCRDGLHGAVIDVELAMRIAARRDQQQRSAARTVQLLVIQLDSLAGQVGEHGERIAELACVDPDQHVVDRIPHGYSFTRGRRAREGRGMARGR